MVMCVIMHFVQSRCKGIRGWGEKGKGGVRKGKGGVRKGKGGVRRGKGGVRKGKGGVRRERWRCVERSEFCCGM